MCTTCNAVMSLDASKSEVFAESLVDTLNKGASALMISIGHRTGLFDVMAELPPMTAEQIAEKAKLHSRYVREWLGAMVSSRVVTYDSTDSLYSLPREHAALLTRAAGADNIATLSQYIAELGSVESQIVDCFREGGGVPYEDFSRFHEIMADDSGQSVLPALFDHILPLVPGIVERLEEGIRVADIGCGRGRALMQMADVFPNSHFEGYEISEQALAWARSEVTRRGLTNIDFILQDAASLTLSEEFDFVCTFDAIHDQAEPQRVLDTIYKALRSNGVYLMQDIDMHTEVGENTENPIATLIYTISCMHCMTVSLAQGGAGLGAAWGVELAEQMLRRAGFASVEIHRLPHDIQNAYYVLRK